MGWMLGALPVDLRGTSPLGLVEVRWGSGLSGHSAPTLEFVAEVEIDHAHYRETPVSADHLVIGWIVGVLRLTEEVADHRLKSVPYLRSLSRMAELGSWFSKLGRSSQTTPMICRVSSSTSSSNRPLL